MTARLRTRIAAALAPLLLLGAAPAPPAPTAEAARAWGIADSDVPADPAVRYGVLRNGLKYALMHNATPKDSIVIRMRVKVGSLYEADDHRGLAHFLEHMAFNGSTHVPEGEMVKLLERKGLAFGADTNASTDFEQTVYKLDLPQATEDQVDTGLMLMREVASELTLDPAAIDRERGVVLSERRTRDTFQLKNVVDNLEFLFAGTKIAARFPVGTVEVISKAPRERLADLYHRYYRPERTTLIVVGDFDVDAMERKLVSRFSDWEGSGPAGAEPDKGLPDFGRGRATDLFIAPELPDGISVTWLKPWTDRPDTVAERRRRLIESVGANIVNRRVGRIVLSEASPITGGGIGIGDAFDIADTLSISASAKDGAWADATRVIENEYRRALQYGFTAPEIAEQLAQLEASYRNAAASADTRRSAGLAETLVAAADGDFVVSTPADQLARFQEAKTAITATAVGAAFRKAADGFGEPLIRVTAPRPVEGGEAAIGRVWDAAVATKVDPPADSKLAAFAYGDFGPAGRIVSDRRIADLGIRRIRFANNVMLNLKRTDFEKDIVRMSLRVDGGALLNTRADPTRTYLAGALSYGGLGKHGFDELRTILAGRTVSPAFGIDTDSFGGVASTRPEDLELQAQLLAAYVTDPGYRADGLALLRRLFPTIYAQNDATPDAVIARDIPGILSGNDPRFVTPPLATVMALDWPHLRSAIAPSLQGGAIEIGLVGDFDEAAAVQAIARTFGALPPRARGFRPMADARKIAFAADRSPRTLLHKGDADQAVMQIYWPTTDDRDLARDVRFDLLAAVMRLELIDELRERLGKTYGGSAFSQTSSDYPGYGHFVASVAVDRADVATTEASIRAIASGLAARPVDADTLERARRPMIEAMTKARRENGYWLTYVRQASSRPDRLERSRRAIGEVQRATAAELQALAKRWLRPETGLVIRAVSDKAK